MKRLISVFLMVCLLLSACGGEAEPTETTAAPTAAPTEAPTQAPTEAPTAEPVETTEAPDGKMLHPLNGSEIFEPYVNRPVTVTINNLSAAMPQHGISQADILYEIETEGGITRCLGVFADIASVEKLGPVRSARTYFNSLTLSYGAVLAHCGGSKYADIPSYDAAGSVIPNWEHVNAAADKGFYRDKDRIRQGYALEHTMFAGGQALLDTMNSKGFPMTLSQMPDYGLNFAQDPALTGETAKQIEIRFAGKKVTKMTYQDQDGLYQAAQYKGDWIDGETQEPLSFRNVIVLKTKQWKPEGYHSMYELQGSGEGTLAIGGKTVPIRWERGDVNEPFRYTLEDGSPVTLGAGKTYIAIISTTGQVSCS